MSFKTQDHDVTCLCALVNLPKRVIVEELPSGGGRARFRVQAFVERDVGELLEWMAPALEGAGVRRWEGKFVFAIVEVEGGDGAEFLRQELRAFSGRGGGELHLALSLEEADAEPAERLRRLVGAMAA
jgi:hypothetical protein